MMIVAHMEYSYSPADDEQMRILVPAVEAFARTFEGCESFQLSFAVDRPGVLLGAEVWRDAPTLNAHLAVAHDAEELAGWHALVTGMSMSLYAAKQLARAELRDGMSA
jgi:quinol monooxygenase YgiN